jgi:hypothetical protein
MIGSFAYFFRLHVRLLHMQPRCSKSNSSRVHRNIMLKIVHCLEYIWFNVLETGSLSVMVCNERKNAIQLDPRVTVSYASSTAEPVFLFSRWQKWLHFRDGMCIVAAQSKGMNRVRRSNAGIVGSNPTQNMDVYVLLFCVCVVLCVGRCLATIWSPI